jgi:putative transposase
MKKNNIVSCRPRKFKATTNSKHNYPVAPNLLNQNFKVAKANYAWVADITYIPTDEGWLYLATIKDLYHKKVIGCSMDSTMTKELAMNALKQAISRVRPPQGVIHHSDRGSQYASHAYQNILREHGFRASMSRKGNCYDNACAESFFSALKNELVYLTRFKTRQEARLAIFEYIEVFYNRTRLHASLGYRTPHEFQNGC